MTKKSPLFFIMGEMTSKQALFPIGKREDLRESGDYEFFEKNYCFSILIMV